MPKPEETLSLIKEINQDKVYKYIENSVLETLKHISAMLPYCRKNFFQIKEESLSKSIKGRLHVATCQLGIKKDDPFIIEVTEQIINCYRKFDVRDLDNPKKINHLNQSIKNILIHAYQNLLTTITNPEQATSSSQQDTHLPAHSSKSAHLKRGQKRMMDESSQQSSDKDASPDASTRDDSTNTDFSQYNPHSVPKVRNKF